VQKLSWFLEQAWLLDRDLTRAIVRRMLASEVRDGSFAPDLLQRALASGALLDAWFEQAFSYR
jgi:hypothetical protein